MCVVRRVHVGSGACVQDHALWHSSMNGRALSEGFSDRFDAQTAEAFARYVDDADDSDDASDDDESATLDDDESAVDVTDAVHAMFGDDSGDGDADSAGDESAGGWESDEDVGSAASDSDSSRADDQAAATSEAVEATAGKAPSSGSSADLVSKQDAATSDADAGPAAAGVAYDSSSKAEAASAQQAADAFFAAHTSSQSQSGSHRSPLDYFYSAVVKRDTDSDANAQAGARKGSAKRRVQSSKRVLQRRAKGRSQAHKLARRAKVLWQRQKRNGREAAQAERARSANLNKGHRISTRAAEETRRLVQRRQKRAAQVRAQHRAAKAAKPSSEGTAEGDPQPASAGKLQRLYELRLAAVWRCALARAAHLHHMAIAYDLMSSRCDLDVRQSLPQSGNTAASGKNTLAEWQSTVQGRWDEAQMYAKRSAKRERQAVRYDKLAARLSTSLPRRLRIAGHAQPAPWLSARKRANAQGKSPAAAERRRKARQNRWRMVRAQRELRKHARNLSRAKSMRLHAQRMPPSQEAGKTLRAAFELAKAATDGQAKAGKAKADAKAALQQHMQETGSRTRAATAAGKARHAKAQDDAKRDSEQQAKGSGKRDIQQDLESMPLSPEEQELAKLLGGGRKYTADDQQSSGETPAAPEQPATPPPSPEAPDDETSDALSSIEDLSQKVDDFAATQAAQQSAEGAHEEAATAEQQMRDALRSVFVSGQAWSGKGSQDGSGQASSAAVSSLSAAESALERPGLAGSTPGSSASTGEALHFESTWVGYDEMQQWWQYLHGPVAALVPRLERWYAALATSGRSGSVAATSSSDPTRAMWSGNAGSDSHSGDSVLLSLPDMPDAQISVNALQQAALEDLSLLLTGQQMQPSLGVLSVLDADNLGSSLRAPSCPCVCTNAPILPSVTKL